MLKALGPGGAGVFAPDVERVMLEERDPGVRQAAIDAHRRLVQGAGGVDMNCPEKSRAERRRERSEGIGEFRSNVDATAYHRRKGHCTEIANARSGISPPSRNVAPPVATRAPGPTFTSGPPTKTRLRLHGVQGADGRELPTAQNPLHQRLVQGAVEVNCPWLLVDESSRRGSCVENRLQQYS